MKVYFIGAGPGAADLITLRGVNVLHTAPLVMYAGSLVSREMLVHCRMDAEIVDNLDLERWFRKPKGHERRIHGHKHAGVRIVQEGPTLVHALDAHLEHDGPFTAEDLLPYRHAQPPKDQQEAVQRRKVMRKARSKKNAEPY